MYFVIYFDCFQLWGKSSQEVYYNSKTQYNKTLMIFVLADIILIVTSLKAHYIAHIESN